MRGDRRGQGGSDIDMVGDEEVLKVPHLKRKTRSSRGSSKAKKGAVKKGGRGAAESESNMETDSADSEFLRLQDRKPEEHKKLQCGGR